MPWHRSGGAWIVLLRCRLIGSQDLTDDLRTFGPRSWPEVQRLVGLAA
jgi:hypothetical protein